MILNVLTFQLNRKTMTIPTRNKVDFVVLKKLYEIENLCEHNMWIIMVLVLYPEFYLCKLTHHTKMLKLPYMLKMNIC